MVASIEDWRRFFRDELEASAPEIEATEEVPEPLVAQMADLGVFGATVPAEYGGDGLSLPEFQPYLENAAMGPGCGRMFAHVANGFWRPLAAFGTAKQHEVVRDMAAGRAFCAFALTEPAGGTGRDLHSRAERDGDGWRATGEKHLITFADRASHLILTVATDERGAADSLTTFLVPRHEATGLRIDVTQQMMGLAGTGHGTVTFDGLRLDDAWRLGEVGQGLEVAMSFLDYSRISLATCMVGTAQRAMDEAVAYARQRVTFGRPIADRQAVQVMVADMATDLAAARALTREAGRAFESGEPVTETAAKTKLFCQRMVAGVTDLALRVCGGVGYVRGSPIERIYRDSRGFWFEEGTAEIQQLVAARQVLRDG